MPTPVAVPNRSATSWSARRTHVSNSGISGSGGSVSALSGSGRGSPTTSVVTGTGTAAVSTTTSSPGAGTVGTVGTGRIPPDAESSTVVQLQPATASVSATPTPTARARRVRRPRWVSMKPHGTGADQAESVVPGAVRVKISSAATPGRAVAGPAQRSASARIAGNSSGVDDNTVAPNAVSAAA